MRGRESLRGHFLRCAGVSGAGSLSRPDGPDKNGQNDDAKQVQTFRGWIRVGDRVADISPEAGGVIRVRMYGIGSHSPTHHQDRQPGNQAGKMAGAFRGQNPHPVGPRSDPMRPARKTRDRRQHQERPRPETISGNRTGGRRSPAAQEATPPETTGDHHDGRPTETAPTAPEEAEPQSISSRPPAAADHQQQRPAVFRRSPERADSLPGRNGSPSRRPGAAERLPK